MELPVLYRDESVVAVHKPPGLFVHRTPLAAPNESFVLQLLRDQIGQRVYPVHRLDRATSGVLLFALSSPAARRLGEQFARGQIEKRYLAVVRGVTVEQWSCDHPIDGQPALTHFHRRATKEFAVPVDKFPQARYSLVEAQPVTGRRHQIRRHLKHAGHPIIGDVNYGHGSHNRFFREHLGIQRLLLICVEMGFLHPATGDRVRVGSRIDDPLIGFF